jgi:YHS domain-containing protein
MLRALIYGLMSILLITFVRGVIGLIMREMGNLTGASRGAGPGKSQAKSADFGGNLVKDPVCGTFVPAGSPHIKSLGGQTYRFCSEECRDKFHA